MLTPTGAVTSGIGVITSRTSADLSATKRMSRLVTMPMSRPSASTTGTPEIRYRPQSASTSRIVSSGEQVIGLVIMPASDRFTRSTWAAWSSIDRLRCSTPMPPCRAIAIAIRASVTVSIALDTSGIDSSMLRVSRVVVVASARIEVALGRQQQHVVEGQAERQAMLGDIVARSRARSSDWLAGRKIHCAVPSAAVHLSYPVTAAAHGRVPTSHRVEPRSHSAARRGRHSAHVLASDAPAGTTVEGCTTSRIDPFAGDPADPTAELAEPR